MKKIILLIAISLMSLSAYSQADMMVYNFTGDLLLVHARAKLNGNIVGFSHAYVAPNGVGLITGVNTDPNATWEIVRGLDISTRRKYGLSFYNGSSQNQGLFITWNSNTQVVFY